MKKSEMIEAIASTTGLSKSDVETNWYSEVQLLQSISLSLVSFMYAQEQKSRKQAIFDFFPF